MSQCLSKPSPFVVLGIIIDAFPKSLFVSSSFSFSHICLVRSNLHIHCLYMVLSWKLYFKIMITIVCNLLVCVQGWGQTIILGVEMYGSPIPVNSSAILRGKTMKGALFGGLKAKSDIPLLVKRSMDKVIIIISFNKKCYL